MDASIQAYIHSTFAVARPAEIRLILDQEGGCEKDTLLDLLFYPTGAIQNRLEPILADCCFDPQDEQYIAEHIINAQPQAMIHYPGSGAITTIRVPAESIQNLIKRLRLSKHPDIALLQTIKAHIPEAECFSILVRIRNADLPCDAGVVEFLNLFFKTIQYDESYFRDCLDFILTFLSELSSFDDICGALIVKKHRLVALLRRAENFTGRLRRANAEMMMLSGQKEPYLNSESLRKTMGIIDLLTVKLFGQAKQIPIYKKVRLGYTIPLLFLL